MEIIGVRLEKNGSLAKRHTIDMIVLHHAAVKHCTVEKINQWHLCNGWTMIGYHYFINKKGEIFRGRPDDVIGAHATGYNSTSIGICFEGDFEKEAPTKEQINSGLELVDCLKNKYNITKVKGHKELMSTSCPGALFPLEQFTKQEKENLILSFQRSATADGFKFSLHGIDGKWGNGEDFDLYIETLDANKYYYSF